MEADDIFKHTYYSSEENHRISSSEESRHTDEDSLDAIIRDYDELSVTPPRTRIHRRLMKKKDISCHKVVHAVKKYSPTVSHFSHGDSEDDGLESKKKTDKRSIHLLRNSERFLKLNVSSMDSHTEEKEKNSPLSYCNFKVESSSCFLSLNSKLIKTAKSWHQAGNESAKHRSEFHEFIENLTKSGNTDSKEKVYKTQISQEHFWQTELKDMIWLELQAHVADRTVDQQDKYILEARKAVPQLLKDIVNYRFEKKQDKLSAESSDSGVYVSLSNSEEECSGCLSLFCPCCMEQEVLALKEVGTLLSQLEAAQTLFPSSKSFGHLFPLYQSKEFSGKVKAMCLWYNMMTHFRLKTIIIGKQILSYAEGNEFEFFNSGCYQSNTGEYELGVMESLRQFGKIFFKTEEGNTSAYRVYIEYVLKTKGLTKSFQFMENLHNKFLRKARIALEKPKSEQCKSYSSCELSLLKYGYWSDIYQSMNLPSFRSAFLFLSRLPLDVLHDFLKMRLESKLEKPSYLSIRQLMKELKDALKLAVIYKERYLYHCEVALTDFDEETQLTFKNCVKSFDKTVEEIIQLYLNYLEQWISLTQFGKLQKNVLEEEWKFIIHTVPHFPDCEAPACNVFCKISCSVLKIISFHIKDTINTMLKDFTDDCDVDPSVAVFCSSNPLHRKMLQLCRGLQTLFLETRDRIVHIVTLMKILVKYCEGIKLDKQFTCDRSYGSLKDLREEALNLCSIMKEEMVLIESLMPKPSLEDSDNFAFQSRCREVINQMYRCTFEYYKEVGKIISFQPCFVRDMFQLAQRWLMFVQTYCEKGRGIRPRWANFGIEFILFISKPEFTKHLSEKEFAVIRKSLEEGILHIKGVEQTSGNGNCTPISSSGYYYRQSFSVPDANGGTPADKVDGNIIDGKTKYKLTREERLIAAINKLEEKMETKLREEELIGSVMTTSNSSNYDKNFIKPRSVTFGWQRGIKIGQGRFGKVYTAVNNDSGELMAMKEISLSPNDVRTIKSVATELKIFEGIQNEYLVRYYGTELHRDELLIFMELCPEGTLEDLIMASENGLPESIVRRFTKQLISAISTLHEHSIVHRDIKTANIFLTSEGNKLKLGDFGSAVKIRAHTTAPGELKGFVGTQAYMAPEVFMKTNTVGHGRAADIWSLGCVVIEMSSGKRPWSEYDSNYQIMFKVGMGETPAIPESLSEEGKTFISKCIQHNPKRRATIKHLSQDNFLKVDSEEDGFLCTMPSELEEYLRLGIKR